MTDDQGQNGGRMKWEFSFVSLLNLIVLVSTVAIGWGVLAERAQNTRDSLGALTRTMAQEAEFRREAQNALETRIRVLEAAQARADERFVSVLQILNRIETQLERLELGP